MSSRCTILVDGVEVGAERGQGLAAALISNGIWAFGIDPVSGRWRGPFCGMGLCFECELAVDGRTETRACMVQVRPGMIIWTSSGSRSRIRAAGAPADDGDGEGPAVPT